MTAKPGKSFYIGTSGWAYPEWKGIFYPEKLAQKNFFAQYLTHFDTVEINSSFYHLPKEQTLQGWYEKTPDDFTFILKASKFITHTKKLAVEPDSIDIFFKRAELLREKCGPVLFQLPPKWGFDAERLEKFLRSLPLDYRYVFELRDQSWQNERAYEILQRHNATFCIYDLKGFQSEKVVTSDLVYVRFHGPKKSPYIGAYGDIVLRGWAEDFRRCWQGEGRTVYCYFDNTMDASAPRDALLLKQLLNEKSSLRNAG